MESEGCPQLLDKMVRARQNQLCLTGFLVGVDQLVDVDRRSSPGLAVQLGQPVHHVVKEVVLAEVDRLQGDLAPVCVFQFSENNFVKSLLEIRSPKADTKSSR